MLLRLGALAALLALSACGVGGTNSQAISVATGHPETFEGPVAKAECGPGSMVETNLQGQVQQSDRVSGRSITGYWCNLEKVGQFQGEGASWQFAWLDDCGYYDQKAPSNTLMSSGAVVVDASDTANPVSTTHLTSTAMLDPWESLKVNEKRKLLGADQATGGTGGPNFDIYDLSSDCKAPVLLSSAPLSDSTIRGHEGNFTPDGLTYYDSERATSRYCPIDVADAAHPALMFCWAPPSIKTHGLSFNESGTRAYLASASTTPTTTTTPNGLRIADTSDVVSRNPRQAIDVISEIFWADGQQTQMSQPFKVKGLPYIVVVDELGHGAARIIDLSDETSPAIVSKLKLEVHMPENSSTVSNDVAGDTFGYEGHYCQVDDPLEATAMACGYFQSGIRVFDIRDPVAPREIAYYNPPAQVPKKAQLGGSQRGGGTADWCSAQVRFIKATGELWTTCQDNGFLVLKFTNGAWPFP